MLFLRLNGIDSMPFDEAIENDSKYVYIKQNELKNFGNVTMIVEL